MQRKWFIFFTCLLLIFLISCQSKQKESEKEVPITYENLTIEQLKKQTTLPVKLPNHLPFDPIDTLITLDDYEELFEDGERIEEISVRYIKTHREGRYIDVSVSNFEQTDEGGETVPLANGREALYAEDEIGQMLFWNEGNVNYRLVYYTSTKVNEGQEPLSLEELVEIANSFELI